MEFIEFIEHFLNYPIKEKWFENEIRACLFATHNDIDAAASLLMQTGFIRNHRSIKSNKCTAVSLIKLSSDENGITCEFNPDIDLKTQTAIAINTLVTQINKHFALIEGAKFPPTLLSKIYSTACRAFYSAGDFTLSATSEVYSHLFGVFDSVFHKTMKHIGEDIDYSDYYSAFDTNVTYLNISEITPNNLVFIPYSDFIFEKISQNKITQNFNMRRDRVLETLTTKYAEHPEWESHFPYTYKQLKEWFSTNTIIAATDPLKGFITKPYRGAYYLNFIDIINQQKEEQKENDDDEYNENGDADIFIFP